MNVRPFRRIAIAVACGALTVGATCSPSHMTAAGIPAQRRLGAIRFAGVQGSPGEYAIVRGGVRVYNDSNAVVEVTASGGCPVRLKLYAVNGDTTALWDSDKQRFEVICPVPLMTVRISPGDSTTFYTEAMAAELRHAQVSPGTYSFIVQLASSAEPGPLNAGLVSIKY